MNKQNKIEIYQTKDGQTQVDVHFEQETVWLSQAQMVDLFGRDQSVVSRHIRNAIDDGEVNEKSNMQKMHIANSDKPVAFYDLDVIISVGYRIKSPQGVQFRRWASQRLKEVLIQGYSLNQQRFEQNSQALQKALKLIEKTAQSPDLTLDAGRGLTEIVSRYTQTFLWLQRYDEGLLDEPKGQTGGDLPTPEQAMQSLMALKQDLITRKQATDLFARSRSDGLAGIFGNLNQSVFGEAAYPTIESKAAHLLYFVVKNHPFSDGNKRSGAFLFVDFLNRNHRLLNQQGVPVINDTGLAALTLLVAEAVELGATPSINNVLKKAFSSMGYTNRNLVKQVSSALATIGQQVGELRNEIGLTSHGKSLEEIKQRNNDYIHTLQSLHDTLLPKLMSGEIRMQL